MGGESPRSRLLQAAAAPPAACRRRCPSSPRVHLSRLCKLTRMPTRRPFSQQMSSRRWQLTLDLTRSLSGSRLRRRRWGLRLRARGCFSLEAGGCFGAEEQASLCVEKQRAVSGLQVERGAACQPSPAAAACCRAGQPRAAVRAGDGGSADACAGLPLPCQGGRQGSAVLPL